MKSLLTFLLFLPLVAGPHQPLKGLAQAYPGYQYGAGWWYVWGVDQGSLQDPAYVPMTRCMEVPDLPAGYSGWLLVGNEPGNPEPYGCPVTPADAVSRVAAIRSAYPDARLVVGNVSAWDYSWLAEYQQAGGTADAWGVHGYIEPGVTLANLQRYWTQAHEATGGAYWITETAHVGGSIDQAQMLVDWFNAQPWVDRWAWFTNKAEGTEPWFPSWWTVQLEDWNSGEATPLGEWYAGLE